MRLRPTQLAQRRYEPEWMDEPDLDAALLERAYRSLSLVRCISRTVPQVRGAIQRWIRTQPAPPRPLRLIDIGTGGGDLLIGIGRWARRSGIPMDLLAADRNPRSLARTARAAEAAGLSAETFPFDAGNDPLPGSPDIVVSSLFLHHLSDHDLIAFLRGLPDSGASLLVMNDLDRRFLGLLAAHVTARLVTRNPVVHADAPQSVRAALRPEELLAHCRSAGLDGAKVRQLWPFRLQLQWHRA